jgi:hypothetical protein
MLKLLKEYWLKSNGMPLRTLPLAVSEEGFSAIQLCMKQREMRGGGIRYFAGVVAGARTNSSGGVGRLAKSQGNVDLLALTIGVTISGCAKHFIAR